MMELETPEEGKQARCEVVAKAILQDKYICFNIKDFCLNEDLKNNISTITCILESDDPKLNGLINASGQGIVDALFNGLLAHLSCKFYSLEQLHFEDFAVNITLNEGIAHTRADAPVEIRLTIATSRFNRVHFRYKSRSMVSAAIEVMRKTIEYFVNLELAVIQLQSNILHAKARNREDILINNISDLAEIVSLISYEKTLEKMQPNVYNSE